MKNNQSIFIVGILLIVLIIIGGIYAYSNRIGTSSMAESHIIFPAEGETLVAGQTYTLKWDNPGFTSNLPGSTTQVFLIDKSLLSQGASVSITDRKYDVPDIGSYDYTIPTGVADGTYFFTIGTTTSDMFTIVATSTAASPVYQ